jgi:outer membrane protein OmpA-like peptidoglycan-associated protein
MKKQYLFIALVSSALFLNSCATILRKDKTQVVNFAPKQDKTLVFVNGDYVGQSPVSMEVDATKDYNVKYVNQSYVTEEFTMKKGILTKWLLADIVSIPATAVVPLIVDWKTGAWNGIKTGNMPSSMKHWSEITNPNDYLNQLFQIENLYFETGSAKIKAEAFPNLDKLASILNNNPDVKIAVHGHTDKTGNYDSNVKLSKDRAASVKQYLSNKGVNASRIKDEGHGPDIPMIDKDTKEAYDFNRRVEFSYFL